MQYFTPKRWVQFQNFADENALNAAHEEWDRALVRYNAHLRQIEAAFPRPVHRLLKEFELHDAEVLAMHRGPRTFTITLRLDPPKPFLLILTYSLVDEPEIDRSALPTEYCSRHPLWLYDELDIGETVPLNRGQVVCTHDILLSDGCEVKLRFWKLVLTKPEALFPLANSASDSARPSVSQSA